MLRHNSLMFRLQPCCSMAVFPSTPHLYQEPNKTKQKSRLFSSSVQNSHIAQRSRISSAICSCSVATVKMVPIPVAARSKGRMILNRLYTGSWVRIPLERFTADFFCVVRSCVGTDLAIGPRIRCPSKMSKRIHNLII
jgi:hypothetical protein